MKKKKKSKKVKKGMFSRSRLLSLLTSVFREHPNKKFNYKQLSKILKIKDPNIKTLVVDVLTELAVRKTLKQEQVGSYRLAKKTSSVISFVKNTNRRGVYVSLEKNKEVFIPKSSSLFALKNDKVEVLVFSKKKNACEGEVIRVLERKKEVFVGVVDFSSRNSFLIPDDKTIPFDIFLPNFKSSPKYVGKKVLVKVDSWSPQYKNPVGKITDVIGPLGSSGVEMDSILFDFGFSPLFSEKIQKETKKLKELIPKAEISRRLDFRKTTTFTIDPEDAKDFDDALSVKNLKNNIWEIGVHIADVSFYVPKGGVIDKEALKRGTSVYLVDRVVSMLPEVLSNNLCSLKPNVDRLAFSVIFKMNKKAEVLDYNIKKTVIHSDIRFTYQKAQHIIDKKRGSLAKELLLLNNLAQKLRKKRSLDGSVNFERSEVKFVLDEKKNPIDVFVKEPMPTNHLVEEFMLLANRTVAKHIGFPKKTAKPFVYRVHDLPDQEKLSSLSGVIKKFGYSLNSSSPKNLSASLNLLLKKIKGRSEQYLIETLVVRSMAKAVYTTKNIGHYGLNFDYYSHFTSPIRRYPDLIVHRLLLDYITSPKAKKSVDLEKSCAHCSEMEKSASSAERESVKYMQAKFLTNQLGKNYDGVISGVTDWGLYVELLENRCEGLVRVASLKGDHYVYDKKKYALVGYQTKVCYQLGQKVKIKIQDADLERRQLYFKLL